ncbi:uncharacterized protein LOC106640616, partial [Copidosoma floridanum]|uniref:uncharacterized protein LOC106640616 n=1 Tax=Copidosoma floridanum TaxID=29053 RepID=UPI0006C99F60
QLERFWEIEDIDSKSLKTAKETKCEAHYVAHTTRNSNGRYIVRLPFRQDSRIFGDSRSQALRRLNSLQKRLDQNHELKCEYERVMQEYIYCGHMSLAHDETVSGYYMPHHAVTKASSSTTKVHVVFDASARTSKGLSLNDALMLMKINISESVTSKNFENQRSHELIHTWKNLKLFEQQQQQNALQIKQLYLICQLFYSWQEPQLPWSIQEIVYLKSLQKHLLSAIKPMEPPRTCLLNRGEWGTTGSLS